MLFRSYADKVNQQSIEKVSDAYKEEYEKNRIGINQYPGYKQFMQDILPEGVTLDISKDFNGFIGYSQDSVPRGEFDEPIPGLFAYEFQRVDLDQGDSQSRIVTSGAISFDEAKMFGTVGLDNFGIFHEALPQQNQNANPTGEIGRAHV